MDGSVVVDMILTKVAPDTAIGESPSLGSFTIGESCRAPAPFPNRVKAILFGHKACDRNYT